MFRSAVTIIRVLILRVHYITIMCIRPKNNFLQICYPDPNHFALDTDKERGTVDEDGCSVRRDAAHSGSNLQAFRISL